MNDKGEGMPERILRDWTDSEAVARAGDDGETLFVRLIQKADDYGCYLATPKLLRMNLYPWREDVRTADVVKRMQKCILARLISVYEVTPTDTVRWLSADELAIDVAEGCKWYALIHNFRQRIREPAPKPKCPFPPDTTPPHFKAELYEAPIFPRHFRESRPNAADRGDSPPYADASAKAHSLAGGAGRHASRGPRPRKKTEAEVAAEMLADLNQQKASAT